MGYKYTEEELKSFIAPLSRTEEERAENTERMIRNAIDSCDELDDLKIEVFSQGSYANNTNVRRNSDVDICVMLTSTFHAEYPDGYTRENYGFSPGTIDFYEYRNLVKKALVDKFGANYITDGNKSIKIHENSYHVKADVVPAFQLRNYRSIKSTNPNKYVEGIWFEAKDNQIVSNYPKDHIQNGRNKNKSTSRKYKELVRIMKHIRNDMVDDGKCNRDSISSFLIECLVWNIPNSLIIRYDSWQECTKKAISYLYEHIKAGESKDWGEVSEHLYLFHNGRKWTREDVLRYLEAQWNYMGY
ncbi:MAG: nucleotidyltransferase [Pseudobutyrivibrio sp.]|nr:nucleotidyltransferase [Pseudobutyrivibrio sp.]